MKVKDILNICNPVWMPGRDYEKSKPVVTVLLPTFKRAESGLFEKAVESVLNQNLKNIELIIIDDCSTDGTFDLIEFYMNSDPRVSCIRHSYNIGLPAISEYEGYIKSKGEYIAFIFDDNEWQIDYLSKTIPFMIKNSVKASYGIARLYYGDGKYISIGEREVLDKYNDLLSVNRIANGAIVLERSVIENVGMYDPHISLARLCDWDLNRRIYDKYRFEATGIYATDEWGALLSDSLGNSLKLNSWFAEERIQNRDSNSLLISNYEECDIFSIEENSTEQFIDNINLFSKQYVSKSWYKNVALQQCQSNENIRRVIIFTSAYDSTVELSFKRMISGNSNNIILKFHSISSYFDGDLPLADVVIFVRDLCGLKPIINKCELLKIPMYYYIDDNFELLKGINEVDNIVSLLNRKYLSKFEAMLVATPNLKEYNEKRMIHDNILLLEPIIGSTIFRNNLNDKSKINIAFLGGEFREETFINIVFPALFRLSKEYEINLFCPISKRTKSLKAYEKTKLNIYFIDRVLSLNKVIQLYGERNIDILVHCGPEIDNNKYKTENALINAVQLGAVLVASKNYPYYKGDDFVEDLCVLCDNNETDWYNSLIDIIKSTDRRKYFYDKSIKYCNNRYSVFNANRVLYDEISKINTLKYIDILNRYEVMYSGLYEKKVLNAGGMENLHDITGNNIELVFSKYIRNKRKYRVKADKDNISEIGLIFSSDFFGCTGDIILNIHQNMSIIASSTIKISDIVYGSMIFFKYNQVYVDRKKSIILEIIPKYINPDMPMGVYEIKSKRTMVYRFLNKLDLKPKGRDVLYVQFK